MSTTFPRDHPRPHAHSSPVEQDTNRSFVKSSSRCGRLQQEFVLKCFEESPAFTGSWPRSVRARRQPFKSGAHRETIALPPRFTRSWHSVC